ncbi:MAG: DUF3854 domain-containing protein [Candidatus Binataceae bacterium]|jgi:hypothetical protein
MVPKNSSEGASLADNHSELIAASAIDPEITSERGYFTATRKNQLAALNFPPSQQLVPSLVNPVWGVSGEIAGYQLRPDNPRIDRRSGKPHKYETLAGMRMALDVPPRCRPLLSNPKVPLFITEGARKADAAASQGLCCIALLGVWSWRGGNEHGGLTVLPDWEWVAPNGRDVYIAFDSDVTLKREVNGALVRLKAFLELRRAKVKIIYLPSGEHGQKVGLDDFIASKLHSGLNADQIRAALFALATDQLRKPEQREQAADDPATGKRPMIVAAPGQLPWLVDRAEDVLVQDYRQWHLFQRGGLLVRVSVNAAAKREKFTQILRPSGAVVLKPASVPMLQDILTRAIDWRRPDRDAPSIEDLPRIDCPIKIGNVYLSRSGIWRLPTLTGVIESPTLRLDGSVLTEPGYDSATGLLLYSTEQWLDVSDRPSRAEVESAVRTLIEPFHKFPFVTEADLAVVLSAILTALERRLLFSAPLHGFDAPTQSSGKSLLADCVALIASGRSVASMPISGGEEELRKKLTSVLLAGDLAILLDNITKPLSSDSLAMILTQPIFGDRLLGKNERPELLTNMLFLATGNNLVFWGDLPTRVIVGRINPKVERPEEREFAITDLRGHVREHRLELVHAGLTLLRAYHVAGRPTQSLRPFGRFEQWSNEIRSAIVWAGLADPCQTRERIVAQDPERDATAAVLKAWRAIFGDTAVPLQKVVAAAEIDDEKATAIGDDVKKTLKTAVLEVAADFDQPGKINVKRLAAWCRGHLDRVVSGLILLKDRASAHGGAKLWQVVTVDSVGSVGSYQALETLDRFQDVTRPAEGAESRGPDPDPPNPPNPRCGPVDQIAMNENVVLDEEEESLA